VLVFRRSCSAPASRRRERRSPWGDAFVRPALPRSGADGGRLLCGVGLARVVRHVVGVSRARVAISVSLGCVDCSVNRVRRELKAGVSGRSRGLLWT
jgi:hypothetical protein